MQENEIWKDIPDYEKMYQASNLGRIKSLPRRWVTKEKILKPSKNVHGYLVVNLLKDNIQKTIQVHQLVAMAFLNHKRCGFELVVNHINHITTDNKLSNLEIVTSRQNSNHKKIKGYSNYSGVTFNKKNKNWVSQIKIKGKSKYLGCFQNELEASNAYQKALNNLKL